jgi:DNA-binding NtrC family response regulator
MEHDAAYEAEPGREAPRARPIPRVNIQAFCEDQDTASVIQKASEDRRLAKAHVTVQMGGVQAAVAFYKNASTPNLIIIESLLDRGPLLADLDRLAEVCDPGTKVVAIGHINDVLLYRELVRRGVSEYVVAPVKVNQIIESISTIYTRRPGRSDRSSPSSAPRAAPDRAPSATTPPSPSRRRSRATWSSPISTCRSARPGSTSTRILFRA